MLSMQIGLGSAAYLLTAVAVCAQEHPPRYTAEMVDLSTGTYSQVADVNDQGMATGCFDEDLGDSMEQAFLHENGTFIYRLGTYSRSIGQFIDEDGGVFGKGMVGGSTEIFRVAPDGTQEVLGLVAGEYPWVSIRGISAAGCAGTIVAGSGSSEYQAWTWTQETGVQLVDLGAATSLYIAAVSPDETTLIAGGVLTKERAYVAAIVDGAGTIRELDPDGAFATSAVIAFDSSGRALVRGRDAAGWHLVWVDLDGEPNVLAFTLPPSTYSQSIAVGGECCIAVAAQVEGTALLARWTPSQGLVAAPLESQILGIGVGGVTAEGSVLATAVTKPLYEQEAVVWSPDHDSLLWLDRRVIAEEDQGRSVVRSVSPVGVVAALRGSETWVLRPAITGDVDGDGLVGIVDLLGILEGWGPSGDPPCDPDLTGDDQVGVSDLLIVLGAWGSS